MGIYRWNPVGETWQAVPGSLDAEQRAMAAPVMALGTYALLAPPGSWMEPGRNRVFLPVVLRDDGR